MKKALFKNTCKVIAASLGLALALPLMAADSGTINYQARLLDSYGRRVNDTVDLSFKIYDAVADGNLLWSETHSGVTVQDGVYSVILGSQTPIPAVVFAQNNVYLELGINSQTMSPRQQMTAAAYALVSRTVMGSNIFENQASGYVGIGTTNPVVKLDVNGTINMIGFKMPTGATDNYVLVSDADGKGNWEPMSAVLDEKDPIFTNWVNVVYNPSTNAIWAAIAQRALIADVATATNDLWTAIGQRVLISTYSSATGDIWSAVSARVLISTYASATGAIWSAVGDRMLRAGDIMTGPLTNNAAFYGNGIGLTNVPASGLILTNYVQKTGDIMTGELVVSNNLTVALTNTAGDVVVTNSISLRGSVITNWDNLTGTLTMAVGNLNTSTTTLNTAVGNLNTSTTTLNTAVGELNVSTTTLNTAVANLNISTNLLNAATNSLNTRSVQWDNAVVVKQGSGTLAYSNVYYFASGSVWSNANAITNATAQGLLGIALGADPAVNGLMINGLFTNHWNFTPGSIIYLQTNNNQITTARPTGTNSIVRIVGYAINSTYIYFNPDRTFIEILGE